MSKVVCSKCGHYNPNTYKGNPENYPCPVMVFSEKAGIYATNKQGECPHYKESEMIINRNKEWLEQLAPLEEKLDSVCSSDDYISARDGIVSLAVDILRAEGYNGVADALEKSQQLYEN